MRVKCLAQEHNTMTLAMALTPNPLNLKYANLKKNKTKKEKKNLRLPGICVLKNVSQVT